MMKRVLLMVVMTSFALFSHAKGDKIYLLTGSYAPASAEGIKVFTFNQNNGHWYYVSGLKGVENPSYFSVSRDGKRVYAVAENDSAASMAVALVFDKKQGVLHILNKQSTLGAAPCNVTLNPQENYALTANYNGGSITLFPLDKSGRLLKGHVIRFAGTGIVKERQEQPHLHCVMFTPDEKLLLANDLGTDKIHVFPLTAKGQPDEKKEYDVFLKPGSGPRHMCFAPNGTFAYVITELSGEVVTLSYKNGKLTPVQYVKADSLNAQGSADIHISPDGRFVYASNRLKGDGIAIFEVNPANGFLTKVGYQPTGNHPRNFVLTPNGRYLLVACRDTNEIIVYERQIQTGLLKETGERIKMERPVCLKFTALD